MQLGAVQRSARSIGGDFREGGVNSLRVPAKEANKLGVITLHCFFSVPIARRGGFMGATLPYWQYVLARVVTRQVH